MIDISTRVLRAMIVLDELRHFSLAAERCFVTQSALSQMISKLEHNVGVRLIDRDRRRVSLTAEGLRFVESARRVMAELDEINQDLSDHALMRKGRVAMAVLPSLASHWLPPIIAQFRSRYPGVHVSLTDASPDRALDQVRLRQVDFALTARGPGMVGFQHRLLFEEKFVLVCHRSHPLASHKRVTLNNIINYDYIRLVRTGSIAQHLEKFFRNIEVKDSGLEVEQVSTLAGLVASNLGISLVPVAAIPYFNPKTVVALPIGGADLARPIYLVWRSAGALSPAAEIFVDMLTIPAPPGKPK